MHCGPEIPLAVWISYLLVGASALAGHHNAALVGENRQLSAIAQIKLDEEP
jgi:hypothetical protein